MNDLCQMPSRPVSKKVKLYIYIGVIYCSEKMREDRDRNIHISEIYAYDVFYVNRLTWVVG